MRRGLILGILISAILHGGFFFGSELIDLLFPRKAKAEASVKTEEVSIYVPPPQEEIPPDLSDQTENQQVDVSTIVPPSLLDSPGNVQPESFTEVMAPPPPPTLGKPDSGMMTVPKGNFAQGRIANSIGQIFNLADLDQTPKTRGIREQPNYPFEMKRAGISGTVQLEFIVDSNGDVRDVVVKNSTHREFESSAIQAVQKWKFTPGKKGGKSVNTRMSIPIAFNLNDED